MSNSLPKLLTNESQVLDRLEGLEDLIRQQHVVITELLLQQTQLLDIRLPVCCNSVSANKLRAQPGLDTSEIALDVDVCDMPEVQSHVKILTKSKMSDSTDSQNGNVVDQESVRKNTQDTLERGFSSLTERHSALIGAPAEAEGTNDHHNHAHWLIQNNLFQSAIYLAILANALQLGLQVDLDFGTWNTLWIVLDYVFTTVFAIEMIASIACLRRKYFQSPWYLLDFFVAWSSIIDTCILRLALGHEDGHQILQAFQFLRLMRMVKVLKMRRDLQCLITGIARSMSSMIWVVVLLVLIIYTYAILAVDIVGKGGYTIEYAEFAVFDPVDRFGTLTRAMFTLFSISILDHWSDIIWPICQVQPYFAPSFFIFLVMTSFALLNAIIGIVVDQTMSASAEASQKDQKAQRDLKIALVQKLLELVQGIDKSHDGMVTREEMANVMQNPDFQHVMEEMELPPGFQGTDLHSMLIEDGSDRLSYHDFVAAMFKLINCNAFQRQCLMKLSLAQVKESLVKLRREMHLQMRLLSQQMTASESTWQPSFAGVHDANDCWRLFKLKDQL